MYHSIEYMPRSTIMRSLHVPTSRFRFQMQMLKLLGYKGLSLKNLKPYLEGTKEGKVVGITFDDGYQNNLFNAASILTSLNFTATCYIVSEAIGTSNSWDKINSITQRPLMTEGEIKKWLDLGMDIGGHTKTHADLTRVSIDEAKEEIIFCKEKLEEMFNILVEDFCYPYGRFNEQLTSIVEKSGYHSATTMQRGRAQANSNKFALPRIPINYHTLPHLFLAKILTRYEDNR